MDQIRSWAVQDYQFRATVPRIAMLRYLACTDPEIGQKLWGVVEEETRGMDTGTAGHNQLAIRFAESIGLTRSQLENAELTPSTAAHLYYVELTGDAATRARLCELVAARFADEPRLTAICA